MQEPTTILITGAGRRLGRATAIQLAGPSRRIVIHYRDSLDDAEETAAKCIEKGAEARCYQADLLNIQETTAMVDAVAAEWGLSVLINNASAYYKTPFQETSEAQYDELMDVNAKAPFFLCQAAAPYLKADDGVIINLVDTAYDRPWPSYIAYTMSKAALVCMTRGLARVLAPNVRVNAVAPGAVLLPEDYTDEQRERSIQRTPLARVGEPGDIAKAIHYLVFDAPYVTGEVLRIDGGRAVD